MDKCPYRHDLQEIPDRIKKLPVSRGYPVPWFVAWQNGEPEFRAADGRKFAQAVHNQLCWVCGERLGAFKTFVIGPMCGLNRTTSEPPCHTECAQWSAINCPFLKNPDMVRRGMEDLKQKGAESPGGIMLERNPGTTLLWTTKQYKVVSDGMGGVVIKIGDPLKLEWYQEGRRATQIEVDDAIERGCPLIRKAAEDESEKALQMFMVAKTQFSEIWRRLWTI